MPARCSVTGCNISRNDFYFEKFPFPKDDALSQQWKARIGKAPDWKTKTKFICSRHFINGAPSNEFPLPTLNIDLSMQRSAFSSQIRDSIIPSYSQPNDSSSTILQNHSSTPFMFSTPPTTSAKTVQSENVRSSKNSFYRSDTNTKNHILNNLNDSFTSLTPPNSPLPMIKMAESPPFKRARIAAKNDHVYEKCGGLASTTDSHDDIYTDSSVVDGIDSMRMVSSPTKPRPNLIKFILRQCHFSYKRTTRERLVALAKKSKKK